MALRLRAWQVMSNAWAHVIPLPPHVATMAAALMACATVIRAILERTVLVRQIVMAFLHHQTAILAAAMVMAYLHTDSLVLYHANPAIVSLVASHRARLVCFPLFQCARLMWTVRDHGQSVQIAARRRHLL